MKAVRQLLSKAGRLFSSPDPVAPAVARLPEPRFEPLDAAFVADPYPMFAALRELEPVHRSPAGTWVLSRHADVANALADTRLGNAPSRFAVVHERNRSRYVCADVANNIIPFIDPPAHTLPRRMVGRAFSDAMRRCLPNLEQIATGVAGELEGREQFDVLHDFSTPYSAYVLCDLLGLPREDTPRLKAWSEYFFYLFTSIPSEQVRDELNAALTEFRAYFQAVIEQRKSDAGDDLVSAMLAIEVDGTRLSDAEVIDHCLLLFADGVENVDRAIAIATALLLDHPAQLQKLMDGTVKWTAAVNECLRLESPAQYIGRVAREAIELHGVTIPQHAGVLLMLGSANRDPSIHAAPDQFDVAREGPAHLSFGKGGHSCVGGPLVRLEMEAALKVLFGTFARLQRKEIDLHWEPRAGHRWLERLPVAT